jgi:CrcB protein
MSSVRDALLVFVGGGSGAVLRWGLGLLVPAPWATLAVNVLGSAALAALLHESVALPAPWRLALGTGVMGGVTTYSAFNHDVIAAVQRGQPGHAALLAVLTVAGCAAGGVAGWWAASRAFA